VSDRMEQFESELAQMRPRAPGPEWSQYIAAALAAERRADRRLIGAMCVGAAAACVIVSLLLGQSPAPTRSSPTVAMTPQVPRLGDDLQAFADAGSVEAKK
jgi:hypothetical protein